MNATASTRLTSLTALQTRALGEVIADHVLASTTSTATLAGSPETLLALLDERTRDLPRRAHPVASLHAVIRKLKAQTTQTSTDPSPKEETVTAPASTPKQRAGRKNARAILAADPAVASVTTTAGEKITRTRAPKETTSPAVRPPRAPKPADHELSLNRIAGGKITASCSCNGWTAASRDQEALREGHAFHAAAAKEAAAPAAETPPARERKAATTTPDAGPRILGAPIPAELEAQLSAAVATIVSDAASRLAAERYARKLIRLASGLRSSEPPKPAGVTADELKALREKFLVVA